MESRGEQARQHERNHHDHSARPDHGRRSAGVRFRRERKDRDVGNFILYCHTG